MSFTCKMPSERVLTTCFPVCRRWGLKAMRSLLIDCCSFTSVQAGTRIWLPFGVDTDLFYPRPPGLQYAYEVAYVGNDIKGERRTLLYICPALKFNFGLYGNWHLSWSSWLKFWQVRPYQRRLALIAKGKIPKKTSHYCTLTPR